MLRRSTVSALAFNNLLPHVRATTQSNTTPFCGNLEPTRLRWCICDKCFVDWSVLCRSGVHMQINTERGCAEVSWALTPFLVWRDTRTRQKNRNKTSRWCSYAGSGMSKIDQRCGTNDTLRGVHLWNKECSAYCSHVWQNTHSREHKFQSDAQGQHMGTPQLARCAHRRAQLLAQGKCDAQISRPPLR